MSLFFYTVLERNRAIVSEMAIFQQLKFPCKSPATILTTYLAWLQSECEGAPLSADRGPGSLSVSQRAF